MANLEKLGWKISRPVGVGFPDFDAGEADIGGEFERASDMQGDVFGGRIETLNERWAVVEVMVVPGIDDRINQAFELVEVHDDADGIEFVRPNGDANAPVVAVEGFEGVVVEAQGVRGGEGAGGGDFEGHREVKVRAKV